MIQPNPWRQIREGWIKPVDLAHLTLDDIDLGNLYLEALDEAQLIAEENRSNERNRY